MSHPIRLAVVGAGKLGGYHANLAAKLPEFDLVGVVDPMEPAREALAEKTGSEAFADLDAVIDRIDAAVLATPTRLHKSGATKLLDAGKSVLVEKPIAATLSEANEIVAAAQRAGRVLQVGHVERFNPAIAAAGSALEDPRFIQTTRTSGYTFRSTDIGAVLDLMIHDIDFVLSLTGSEVVDVSAIGLSVLGGHEDMATAQLRFANGCVAQLEASRVSYELRRDARVFTASRFTSLDFATGKATVVAPTEEVVSGRFDGESLSSERKAEMFSGKLFEDVLVKTEHEAPSVNAIEEELKDFAGAIAEGRQPKVTGSHARDAVDVAERVLDAINRHQWDGNPTGRVGRYAAPAPGLRKAG